MTLRPKSDRSLSVDMDSKPEGVYGSLSLQRNVPPVFIGFIWNIIDFPLEECPMGTDVDGPRGLAVCGTGNGTISEGTITGRLYGMAMFGQEPARVYCREEWHRFTFRRKE